jgi:hypothetical protein
LNNPVDKNPPDKPPVAKAVESHPVHEEIMRLRHEEISGVSPAMLPVIGFFFP